MLHFCLQLHTKAMYLKLIILRYLVSVITLRPSERRSALAQLSSTDFCVLDCVFLQQRAEGGDWRVVPRGAVQAL